jgi:hypothetical protein
MTHVIHELAGILSANQVALLCVPAQSDNRRHEPITQPLTSLCHIIIHICHIIIHICHIIIHICQQASRTHHTGSYFLMCPYMCPMCPYTCPYMCDYMCSNMSRTHPQALTSLCVLICVLIRVLICVQICVLSLTLSCLQASRARREFVEFVQTGPGLSGHI